MTTRRPKRTEDATVQWQRVLLGEPKPTAEADPYNARAKSGKDSVELKPRRSLNDMRRLSESIRAGAKMSRKDVRDLPKRKPE
jgi:hypothetical protein